jgi:hypothetical protein
MVKHVRLAPWRILAGVLLMLAVRSASARSAAADDAAAAFRVPPVNGLSGLYWLAVSDFTPGERVSVTLTAPDGESCPALDITSGISVFAASVFGGGGLTVAPGLCAPVKGQWTATFVGASGRTVATSFAFAPNQIAAVPYVPHSK